MEMLMLFGKLAIYGIGLASIGAIPLVLVVLTVMNYFCKKKFGETIF